MVNEYLQAAGFVLDETYRHTRFPSPPAGKTYALYFDDITPMGPDHCPGLVRRHDVTVEMYEPEPDDAREEAFEAVLDAAGIEWSKQDRYWLREEQRYQTIYEFFYIEKRRE
jgi:hypothetical protein